MPRKLALRLLFSAEPISAAEAHTGGLVSEVVADEVALQSRVTALADSMAQFSPQVLALGKAAVLRHESKPLPDAYALASDIMVQNIMSQPDAHEGFASFLAKRKPVWATKLK